MGIKVILTGATGMVGEGVLLECLQNTNVDEVLIVNRRHIDMQHPKLKELLVKDFLEIRNFANQLGGYDACFFCAGVSSVGKDEETYTRITYDTTLAFAEAMVSANPNSTFCYITGSHTDSSEQGRVMWARVKGRTENALMRLPFKGAYNFRPGIMTPVKGQKNVRWFFKPVIAIFPYLLPSKTLSLNEVGIAMINATQKGYRKNILEIKDIKDLAKL